MSKYFFPTVTPHLNRNNIYTQKGIVLNNYNRLLEYHIKHCGLGSSWCFRSEIFILMLEQCRYLQSINESISVVESDSFPYSA